MSKIYKAKFRDQMIKEGLYSQIPSDVWNREWNVNVQAVSDAERSVRYLSRYVFQTAISDYRIVNVDGDQVTFCYRKPDSTRDRRMTLDAMEFIRRFLQHVLPSGFMKVRYYGFLKPNSAVKPESVRCAIGLRHAFEVQTPEAVVEPLRPLCCPDCGGGLDHKIGQIPAIHFL